MVDRAFAPGAAESAARTYLGEASEHLTVSIEKCWVDDARQSWAGRHEELLRLDERRKELDGRPDLGIGETLEYIISTAETEGAEAALPLARELVSRRPAMLPARFVLGRLLLDRNDPEGVEHVEVAMSGDDELVDPGCHLIVEFLRANGRHAEARTRIERQRAVHCEPGHAQPVTTQQGDGERRAADAHDAAEVTDRSPPAPRLARHEPHGLDSRGLLPIRRKLAPMSAIARAWLVRGEIDAGPGVTVAPARHTADDGAGTRATVEPPFILGIEPMHRREDATTIVTRIAREVDFPGPTSIVVLTRRQRELRRRLQRVDGSLIFQRTRRKTA